MDTSNLSGVIDTNHACSVGGEGNGHSVGCLALIFSEVGRVLARGFHHLDSRFVTFIRTRTTNNMGVLVSCAIRTPSFSFWDLHVDLLGVI